MVAGISVLSKLPKKGTIPLGAKTQRNNGTPNADWSMPLYSEKVEELNYIVSRYKLLEHEKALFRQFSPALRQSHYNYITKADHEDFITLMIRAFARTGKEKIVLDVDLHRSIFVGEHGEISATADGYSFTPWLKPGIEEAKTDKDEQEFSMKDAYILALLALSDDSTRPPENKIRLEGTPYQRKMLENAITDLNYFLPKKEQRLMTHKTGMVNWLSEIKADNFSKVDETFEELFGIPRNKIKYSRNPFKLMNTVPAAAMGFAPARNPKSEETAVKTADDAVAQAVAASKAEFKSQASTTTPANPSEVAGNNMINMIAELEKPKGAESVMLTDSGQTDLVSDEPPIAAPVLTEDELREEAYTANHELPANYNIGEDVQETDFLFTEIAGPLSENIERLARENALSECHEAPELATEGLQEVPPEIDEKLAGIGAICLENVNGAGSDPELSEIDVTGIVAEVGEALSQDEQLTAQNGQQGQLEDVSEMNGEAELQPAPAPLEEASSTADQTQKVEQGLFTVHSAPLYAEEIYATVRNLVCSMPEDYAGRTIDRLEKVIDSMPQFPGRENLKDSKRLATAIAKKLEKQGLVRLSTNPNGEMTIGHVTTFTDRGAEFNTIAKNMLKRPENWIGQSVDRIAGGLEILAAGKGLPPVDRNMTFFTAQGMLDFMVYDGIVKLDAQSRIASIATNLLDIPAVRKDFGNARAAAVHYQQAPQMPVERDRAANDYAEPSLVA